jgi:His-Xaa-Ser system radical SAM maturase HxsB
MKTWPLKFRTAADGELLFSDDAGAFFKSDRAFLRRIGENDLTLGDATFLMQNGHAFREPGDIEFLGFLARWSNRYNVAEDLNYVILVPTLRCDLDCTYCQVSRANQNAKGFDWSDETLHGVLAWLEKLQSKHVKIEFQGGEPLLRLDLLEKVRAFCRDHFAKSEFIVCTNLQAVSEQAWAFLASSDTYVSTSLDGTYAMHQAQRTRDDGATLRFRDNLNRAIAEFGSARVSALPTIDPSNPPAPIDIIQTFAGLGLRSIFLRQVNYQGFARKRYDFEQSGVKWLAYYRNFIFEIIRFNALAEAPVEEYYFSLLLNRIVQGGHNGHVDLRNPNWLGRDYIVIDFDGKLYPTDEARMMTRVGQIDLSIGTIAAGIDSAKVELLNTEASNLNDPTCNRCVYQAYCGVDRIDEISRHGRVDTPRLKTAHCQTHLALFDFVFELLYSDDVNIKRSLAAWLHVPKISPLLTPRHS